MLHSHKKGAVSSPKECHEGLISLHLFRGGQSAGTPLMLTFSFARHFSENRVFSVKFGREKDSGRGKVHCGGSRPRETTWVVPRRYSGSADASHRNHGARIPSSIVWVPPQYPGVARCPPRVAAVSKFPVGSPLVPRYRGFYRGTF